MGNYYLYKIAIFLTRSMPLSFSYALAVFLSDCQYLLSKSDREAVRKNLKIILKVDQVPSDRVRDVFRYFGKYLVDFFTLTQRVNKKFVKDAVEISGIEHLNDVLNKNKGGIIISAHLGNWEMAAAVLGLLEYPVSMIALAHKDERVNAFFNQQREFFGSAVIQTNVAVRRCFEHLKNNRLVALLVDRDFGYHGLKMNFLGRKSNIPKGAALFALKTRAPLIPVFFFRTADDKFRFIISKPIYPPLIEAESINDQAVESFVKQYLPLIEEQICKNPCQWLMFQPFEVT